MPFPVRNAMLESTRPYLTTRRERVHRSPYDRQKRVDRQKRRSPSIFGFLDDEAHQNADEAPLFHWEDSRTLVQDLLQTDPTEDGDEAEDSRVASLLEELQSLYEGNSQSSIPPLVHELANDTADVLVPAVNQVRRTFHALDSKVDGSFAEGIANFERATGEVEEHIISSGDRVREEYLASQSKVKALFSQLRDAYAVRDRHWEELATFLDDQLNPLLEEYDNLPTKTERLISYYDKQGKAIARKDQQQKKSSSNTGKTLKNLLAKL